MSKRIARVGVLVALAMIFSYIEAIIHIPIPIPGIKLGIANLVVVTALYVLTTREAFLISTIRILLIGLLFGNGVSIIYSLAGGMLSFFVMLLLKKLKVFSVVGVSIAGGASHNVGQIATATLILGSTSIVYYLPVLLVAGVITGLVIGVLSGRLIPVAGFVLYYS